jgi:ABC-type lipoprotein export system ATPase subunit
LDGFNKQEILLIVKQLTLQNKLITIIVSHDDDVLKICDHMVELKK